jgi:hypothetical protein
MTAWLTNSASPSSVALTKTPPISFFLLRNASQDAAWVNRTATSRWPRPHLHDRPGCQRLRTRGGAR